MTQKQQIKLFQEIVSTSIQINDPKEFGEKILSLLQSNEAKEWWENKTNPKTFSKEELSIINAFKSGYQFYRVDGVVWYWENNIQDGNGPWDHIGHTPNLRIVSSRMLNKLIDCNQFPKDYFKFKL